MIVMPTLFDYVFKLSCEMLAYEMWYERRGGVGESAGQSELNGDGSTHQPEVCRRPNVT